MKQMQLNCIILHVFEPNSYGMEIAVDVEWMFIDMFFVLYEIKMIFTEWL